MRGVEGLGRLLDRGVVARAAEARGDPINARGDAIEARGETRQWPVMLGDVTTAASLEARLELEDDLRMVRVFSLLLKTSMVSSYLIYLV